jgi:hypothetical protein
LEGNVVRALVSHLTQCVGFQKEGTLRFQNLSPLTYPLA